MNEKKKWTKKNVLMGIGILFVLLQLIPVNRGIPDVDPKGTFFAQDEYSKELRQTLKTSCGDCHSYETSYPSYATVAPLSLWIQSHINGGRDKMNLSIWNSYSTDRQRIKIENSIEAIEKGWMPMKSYTWMHSGTSLDEAKKEKTILALKELLDTHY